MVVMKIIIIYGDVLNLFFKLINGVIVLFKINWNKLSKFDVLLLLFVCFFIVIVKLSGLIDVIGYIFKKNVMSKI